jgi:hypothetical protein
MVSYSYYRARLLYYTSYRTGCDGNDAEFRPFYGGDRFYDNITCNKSRSVANKITIPAFFLSIAMDLVIIAVSLSSLL